MGDMFEEIDAPSVKASNEILSDSPEEDIINNTDKSQIDSEEKLEIGAFMT